MALEIDPIVHEDYGSPKSSSNDIALLKLAEPVDLNIYTPACLAALDADYTGQNGRVYGNYTELMFQDNATSFKSHERSFMRAIR